MRTTRQARMTGVLGLGLVLLPLAWLARNHSQTPMEVSAADPGVSCSSDGPSEAARRASCRAWIQAEQAVNRECETLEAWDPQANTAAADITLRRELLAQDRSGNLQRAHREARLAAALARTPHEMYEAALMLVRIEHHRGDHQVEREQARRLMALAPGSQTLLRALWPSARLTGLEAPTQRADAALRVPKKARCGAQAISR